jgi:hypothetical protein
MNTTELITAPAADERTFGEMVAELVPLVGAVAGYGPPVISLVGPWLLLALLLAAPFAFLLTLLAAMLLVTTIVAALVATPYLAVRYLRSVRAARTVTSSKPAPRLVTTRVAT